MPPQDLVSDIKGKVIAGVIVALTVAAWVWFATWLDSRASAQEVAHAVEMHDSSERAHGGKIKNIESAVRQVQTTTNAIAILLDRKDKEEGGPGLPPDALKIQLLE